MEWLKKRSSFGHQSMEPVFRAGLTKRWLRNAFGIIVLFLLVLQVVFSLLFRSFYYQGVETSLKNRALLYRNSIDRNAVTDNIAWNSAGRTLIADFTDKDQMEVQVLDDSGQILFSSSGFVPGEGTVPEDFLLAVPDAEGQGLWRGYSAGEPVMALSSLVFNQAGQTVGALRYVTSLTLVNRQIWLMIAALFGVLLLIVFFVSLSGSFFIRSILNPVTAIGRTARRIAMGEYDARLEKRYDDEIGDLCDTINFMASEIGTAERMKNEFISSVSHELRTPLTAIKGWCETMASAPEDTELMTRGLGIIGKEAGRLSGIVEELLDFSRMESGHILLHRRRMDLLAELEETVFLFRDRVKRTGQTLEFVHRGNLPPVEGDADRLRQVLVNLLDNAVKYSEPGDRIRVEATPMEEASRKGVQVVVSDTGKGIAPDELPRIRQKFYQVDSTQSGAGIGLALVDEIIRLHDGTMEIDSEPGVGTAVTLWLPCAPDEKRTPAPERN